MNKLQKWAHVRQDEVVLMWSPFHVCISSLNQNCCTNRMDPPSQAWTNARARTLSVISDIRCCKTQSATWLWIQMPAETRISIWCQRAPGTGKQKTTNNIFFSYNRATILQTSMCADGHSQINHRTIKSPCVHTRRFKAIAQFLQLECRLWCKYMASGRNNRQHPLRRRSHIQRSTQRKDQTAHCE